MIKARNLTKKYGSHTVVDELSFEIETGEICGFLGPNGAGKTSTMRILTGFMLPSAGSASVAGFDVFENPFEVKKRVGYLPESTPLYTDMRVLEYLDFVAEIKGLRGDNKRAKLAHVMDMTGIMDRERSLIGTLSKGYRQRVGLAQALIGDPQALILDEPTIGLDPKQIIDIRSLIKDLAGKRTIILSSHILSEVQMICSRVIIINKGKLVASDKIEGLSKQSGAITAIIDGPKTDIIESFHNLSQVESVTMSTQDDGTSPVKYELKPKLRENPRKEIIKLIAERQWDLIEFSSSTKSLEEIYINLISSPDGVEGAKENENPGSETEEAQG